MKKILSQSTGAIVLSPKLNKILIVYQAQQGYWVFHKGKIESQETEIDTLTRELKEEIGLTKFSILPNFRETIYFDFQLNEQIIVHREITYYLVRAQTMDVTLDQKESSEHCWCDFQEVMRYLKYPNQQKLVRKVRVYLKEYHHV